MAVLTEETLRKEKRIEDWMKLKTYNRDQILQPEQNIVFEKRSVETKKIIHVAMAPGKESLTETGQALQYTSIDNQ